MYESKKHPVLPLHAFIKRLTKHLLLAIAFTSVSLLIGMQGYHVFEGLGWTDCFLNAAMILGGMGEVAELKTEGGKLFAGFYALYSGLWVIVCMGFILAPIFHRVLHKFHEKHGTTD